MCQTDRNSNGQLNYSELVAVCSMLLAKQGRSNQAQIPGLVLNALTQYDLDASGSIDFYEFTRMLTKKVTMHS